MALDADPATSANAPATIPGIGREYPPVPARAMFGRDGDIAAPDGASRANSAYHIRRRKSKRNATQPLDRFPSERITMAPKDDINRREFLSSAASGVAAFHIVPSHVPGGRGHAPPVDTITL